ncbi:hypothetical protein CHH28_13660 [Bacterioplanes sanyensis]|uniref:Uncharacterized protein n=1 Tax=Bacterioplanes sanyensis TaxID=1249553 RepID=A0A222FMA7_9GAMM|nr:hypothetical protein [Bacterioplanes sanyensis]ASP39654.1 hypothetical protein CHH28_13660 [Bacterioplanes sanyensis]
MAALHTLASRMVFIAITALVSLGVTLRLSEPVTAQADIGPAVERQAAVFLNSYGFAQIKRIHFTKDAGITGVQGWSQHCQGFLHIMVMPQGDEFLSLWQSRSASINNRTAFVFQQRISPQFPSFDFWWQSMLHALLARLHIKALTPPEPVVALSFPQRCETLTRLPWQHLFTVGEA